MLIHKYTIKICCCLYSYCIREFIWVTISVYNNTCSYACKYLETKNILQPWLLVFSTM